MDADLALGYAQLARMVDTFRYRRGWRLILHTGPTHALGSCTAAETVSPGSTSGGRAAVPVFADPLMLVICARVEDSGQPGHMITLEHWFAVPPDTLAIGWDRWLLDRCLDVDRHEAMELFEVDGRRPFYPEHGDTARLYQIIRRP